MDLSSMYKREGISTETMLYILLLNSFQYVFFKSLKIDLIFLSFKRSDKYYGVFTLYYYRVLHKAKSRDRTVRKISQICRELELCSRRKTNTLLSRCQKAFVSQNNVNKTNRKNFLSLP